MNYLLNQIFKQAVLLYILLLVMMSTFYSTHVLPFLWVLIGVGTVFLSFRYFSRLSLRWAELPERIFRKRIFWTALWIRVVYVFGSYLIFLLMTGRPFEFHTADAYMYHLQSLFFSKGFLSENFNIISLIHIEKYASWGIILFMGFVYTIFFSSIIVFRIVNAVLGSLVCVYIYEIAQRSFGEKAARIAGGSAVVAPPLIYYCGLHLKEATIVYLVFLFVNVGDQLLKARKVSGRSMILLLGSVAAMFLFRNALAVAMILSFILSVAIMSNRISRISKRFLVGFLFVFALSLVFVFNLAPEAKSEAMYYFNIRKTQLESHMRLYASRGNYLAVNATKAIFAPLVFIGPLPTLVNTHQENTFMMAGSMFYRNVFTFFSLFTILLLIRTKQWRQHVLLLSVFFSWVFILANSGFALQDRFHLILVPAIIILGGYGISMAKKRAMTNFKLYLLFLGVLIFAWNTFKLAGRGLI